MKIKELGRFRDDSMINKGLARISRPAVGKAEAERRVTLGRHGFPASPQGDREHDRAWTTVEPGKKSRLEIPARRAMQSTFPQGSVFPVNC